MIPYREIEAVFFDFGGTIAAIDFNWISKELTLLGLDVGAEQLRRAEAAIRPALSAKLGGPDPPADSFPLQLSLILERSLPPSQHDLISTLVMQLIPTLRPGGKGSQLWSEVLPDIPEILVGLSKLGLRLAVVSNSDGSLIHGIKALRLDHFFDVIIDSAVVGYAKPDPRIFQSALDAVGVPAALAIHVGDMYFADIEGARAAGLHSVLVDPYGDWVDVDDCVRVVGLAELAANLEQGRR